MKKSFLLISLMCVFVAVFAQCSGGKEKARILIVPREGSISADYMIEKEVGVIAARLRQAGFITEVATLSGKPIKGLKTELKADSKIGNIKVSRYVGVVMTCMAAGGVNAWHASPDEIRIVKEANRNKIPIAAQASAIIILAEAGLLDGKKYCYYKDPTQLNESFSKGIYGGLGVVQDGLIITSSSCPYVPLEYGSNMTDYTSEFADMIIKAVNR